jgi:hypothetical protein
MKINNLKKNKKLTEFHLIRVYKHIKHTHKWLNEL